MEGDAAQLDALAQARRSVVAVRIADVGQWGCGADQEVVGEQVVDEGTRVAQRVDRTDERLQGGLQADAGVGEQAERRHVDPDVGPGEDGDEEHADDGDDEPEFDQRSGQRSGGRDEVLRACEPTPVPRVRGEELALASEQLQVTDPAERLLDARDAAARGLLGESTPDADAGTQHLLHQQHRDPEHQRGEPRRERVGQEQQRRQPGDEHELRHEQCERTEHATVQLLGGLEGVADELRRAATRVEQVGHRDVAGEETVGELHARTGEDAPLRVGAADEQHRAHHEEDDESERHRDLQRPAVALGEQGTQWTQCGGDVGGGRGSDECEQRVDRGRPDHLHERDAQRHRDECHPAPASLGPEELGQLAEQDDEVAHQGSGRQVRTVRRGDVRWGRRGAA